MKKLIIIAAAVAAVAAGGAVALRAIVSQSDPIFEANVEALTRNEGGGFGPMCSQTGKSGNYRMKLCTDCDGPMGDYAMDYVAFCN